MNKVILMGRLTADPELRQTPAGVSVASFTIAVDKRFAKDGERQADFIRCTAWRNTAEFICKYFEKGKMIAVVGNIQTRTWENEEGKNQYATDIIIDEAYFAGSKNSTGNDVSKASDGFGFMPEFMEGTDRAF